MRAVWRLRLARRGRGPACRDRCSASCVLALVLCGAIGGSGCNDPDPDSAPAPVFALQLDAIEGESALSSSWIRERLDAAVRGSTVFVDAGSARGPRPLEATLRMRVLRTTTGAEVLRVELAADPPPDIRAALGRDFEAVIELERIEGEVVPEEDLPVALRRAVAVLEAKVLLVRGDRATLERLLTHPDSELVILTLDWIHGQRLREHADNVAALLDHTDDRVALRAVECLGVVGTQRHARLLVTRPRLADRAHANRLYETLARLGGPDAAGFLEFAARNEDDPEMADVARRALDRVRQPYRHPADGDPLPRGHR